LFDYCKKISLSDSKMSQNNFFFAIVFMFMQKIKMFLSVCAALIIINDTSVLPDLIVCSGKVVGYFYIGGKLFCAWHHAFLG